jgi:ubiquitin-protein ligase
MMPNTPARRRLVKDLSRINQHKTEEFMVAPMEDNLMLWTATIEGADDTPWEGGLFTLTLHFTERYPDLPPKVRFVSKMFHPNIYSDGRIFLDSIYLFT